MTSGNIVKNKLGQIKRNSKSYCLIKRRKGQNIPQNAKVVLTTLFQRLRIEY